MKKTIQKSYLKIAMSLTKPSEGLRLKPYRCTAGKLTIGYGRNLEDVGISEQEAEYLLDQDMQRVQQEALAFPFFEALNDYRKAVILDMLFNLGLSRFKRFKQTLLALERHDYQEAANQMLDSKWAIQVGIRADRLAEIMRTGEL